MKRLFRIVELSKNEQRVVLIVMLVLLTVVFVRYQHRSHHSPADLTLAAESKASPTPVEAEAKQSIDLR